ncbi:MAG: bifunctional nuclease family protein [Desulfobacterales bacterium]|nr:bifunctional nuclease family protein [Desulfobacterales bacterium]
MEHKVSIAGMAMDPASNTPIVLLKTDLGEQVIPIWIGLMEATAIASVLRNVNFDRPMTHDLFKNFAVQMKMAIVKVEVCDIRENTYYALITFSSGSESFTMDARPSDAIAMALRFGAPIFVNQLVLDKSKSGQGVPAEAADQSEEGKKWAEYLENLDPDDFGKV